MKDVLACVKSADKAKRTRFKIKGRIIRGLTLVYMRKSYSIIVFYCFLDVNNNMPLIFLEHKITVIPNR